MAASYPGAIKTFSAITSGATVLEQSLYDDAISEVEAIEAELGLNVHGSAGSLAERVNLAMDWDGGVQGKLSIVNATDSQGRRLRCGVETVSSDSLVAVPPTGTALAGRKQVTFSPSLSSLNGVIVFCELQLTESDPSASTVAAFIGQYNTASASAFTFFVTTALARMPAAGTSFLVHWIAFEDTSSSLATL